MKELILVGICGAVAIFIGAYLIYRFRLSLHRRQERRKASAEFRASFTDAIKRLEKGEDPFFVYTDSIKDQHGAIIPFRPHLNGKEAKRKVKP